MISLEVFINGENINLCKPDKDFALNSDWYNWFNDQKNTKFLEQGINADLVTGDTPKADRAQILHDLAYGNVEVVVNVSVLAPVFKPVVFT